MKTVLCYGDSNTWGYMPNSGGLRFDEETRWTGVLSRELGAEYRVLEDGLNGRTTVWEKPFEEYRSGLEGLGYCLHSVKPIDLMVMMLGSNDMNFTDAFGVYKGLQILVNRVVNAQAFYPGVQKVFPNGVKLLLVSPILMDAAVGVKRPELHVSKRYPDTLQFAYYTKKVAEEYGVEWMDAAEVAHPDPVDCLHMDAQNHLTLGKAIAEKVRTML